MVTFTGKHLEISRPLRLVYTAARAPYRDGVVAMVTFTAKDGMTDLVARY